MPQLINATRLKTIESNFNTLYGEGLKKQVSVMDPMIQSFSADSYILTDIYAGQMPPMRKFKGARNHRNVLLIDNAYNQIAKECEEWESTVDVARKDILADRLNVYRGVVTQAGSKTVQHADLQATRALLNGTTTHKQYVGPDGVAIFSTAHTLNPAANQSNLMTGSLTADNLALGLARLKSFKGNEGGCLFVGYDEAPFLVVPTALEITARQIVEGAGLAANLTLPGITSNMLLGRCKVVVNPYLDVEPTNWYIVAPHMGVNPIAYYQFIPVEFIVRMDLSDPIVYETQNFSFGAYSMTHALIVNFFQAIKFESTVSNSLYTGNTILEDIV